MTVVSRILPVRDPQAEGKLSQIRAMRLGATSGCLPSSDSFRQERRPSRPS